METFELKIVSIVYLCMMSEQQDKIFRRTEELFLRYGIKSVTMDDVARELGISKKTLYQFVENKNDLVDKVMGRHIEEQCKLDEDQRDLAENAIDEMLTVIKNTVNDMRRMKANIIFELQKYHREVWEKIQHHQVDYITKAAINNIKWGREHDLYRGDFDVELAVKFYISGIFSIFNEQLFPQPPYNYETLFKEYIMNYLHGIASDKGRQYLKEKYK